MSTAGIKSVAELISTAHKRPNPLLYGTPGVGSGPHLAIELFAIETKIKVLHVPYRGSAPAVMELVGGRLDFMMDPPATMMEFIRNGKLRALAVSSAKEYFALPSAPTIAESGVKGFDVSAWQGLVAPAGLPEPIVNRLNTEVVRILKDPATVERMHTFGNEPAPTTPAEFKKRLIDDIAKWTAVAEQNSLRENLTHAFAALAPLAAPRPMSPGRGPPERLGFGGNDWLGLGVARRFFRDGISRRFGLRGGFLRARRFLRQKLGFARLLGAQFRGRARGVRQCDRGIV